jgi:hypothetical protein
MNMSSFLDTSPLLTMNLISPSALTSANIDLQSTATGKTLELRPATQADKSTEAKVESIPQTASSEEEMLGHNIASVLNLARSMVTVHHSDMPDYIAMKRLEKKPEAITVILSEMLGIISGILKELQAPD